MQISDNYGPELHAFMKERFLALPHVDIAPGLIFVPGAVALFLFGFFYRAHPILDGNSLALLQSRVLAAASVCRAFRRGSCIRAITGPSRSR